jgi:putative aldouronate transport system substrate-binding protein
MKLKHLSILTLVGAITLAGCSSTTSKDPSSSAPQITQAAASATPTGAPVKANWFSDISFWTPPSPWNSDPNSVEGTITKATGLTFELNVPAQDADTKLNLMIVSNALSDVITISNDVMVKKLIKADKVWNLEELLKKYDPTSPLLTTFPADLKKALTTRDGGWYAYPSHMDTPDARKLYPPSSEYFSDGAKYRSGYAIMFNEQLLKEAGLTLADVKTEDGVLAAFKKVKDMKYNGASVIPFLVDGKTYQSTTLDTLEVSFGAMPIDKNGNYRDKILAPETKHALDFMFNAAQGGAFDQGQVTLDAAGTQAAVTSGRVFAFIGNSANTGFTEIGKPSTWVSGGPIFSNQKTKPTYGRNDQAATGWMQTFISKSAKDPERLAKWLSFMASNEGMLLNYYGFKDDGYTLNDKGLAVQTEKGMQQAKDQAKTGVFAFWPFHNIAWHDHATEAPTSPTGADGLMAMQIQTAYAKNPETFLYDNSVLSLPSDFIPAGSKMANDQAQIKTYLEFQISKIVFAKDAATENKLYNEMISKLKQMGIDEIGTKMNEQLQKQAKDLGVTVKGVNS